MTKPLCDRGPSHRPNVRPFGSHGPGGRTHALALLAVLGLGAALVLPGPPAIGQVLRAPEAELEDVIEIALVGRDLLAYDLLGSGSPSMRLEIGEEVAWMHASGRIGVVVTDRRLLAVTNASGIWHEERLRVHESRPDRALLGKRVALVVTDKRLLGFDSGSATWLDIDIGPNERVREARVGAQTGLVLTDRTAYGLSPHAGGFFATPMSVQERVESVRVGANMATISTSRRVLVFRAPSGTWTEDRRKIN
jgi:hypothetical protein